MARSSFGCITPAAVVWAQSSHTFIRPHGPAVAHKRWLQLLPLPICVTILLIPSDYTDRELEVRTTCTKQGEALIRSQLYKKGKAVAKPGEHYITQEPTSNEYYLFPESTGPFRHLWILVRKPRPEVVVIANLRLPSMNKKLSV